MRNDRNKCQVFSVLLKLDFLMSGTLIVATLNTWKVIITYFTSFWNYNGGTINFEGGSLARVESKGSIAILGCPKLDGVLYVDGLKENLLSISQMCNKDHMVNFCQDLCELVNKDGTIIITRHRTIDNYYMINLNSRTPFVCSRAKLDPTKLWHRRLGHITIGIFCI